MKSYFKLVWTASLIASISFMITACDKKKTDEVRMRGNISSSGQSLYSNSTFNGRPLQVTVSDLQRSNYGGNYGNNYGNNSFQFNVNVNGYPQMITVTPGQSQSIQLNGIYVGYDARCADYSCDRVGLSVWLSMQGAPEWKQIGMYKIMSQNIIASGIELTGLREQMFPTADMMLRELQAVYGQ